MSLAETVRDVAAAAGGLTGLGLGIKYVVGQVTDWLGKREDRLGVEAKAKADTNRADEDTAQHALRLAGKQAHHNSECLELVREQGVEIGKVRVEVGNLREKLGRTTAKLELCEERHDEKDGELLAMRSRLDVLERRTTPPPIAAE